MSSPVIFSLTQAQADALLQLSWGGQPELKTRQSAGIVQSLMARGLVTGAVGALTLTQLGRDAARLAERLRRASPAVDTRSLPLPGVEAHA